MAYTEKQVVGEFEDKYERKRTIRKGRHGLQLQQVQITPSGAIAPVVGKFIGAKIREMRQKRGWTMPDLGREIGIVGPEAKTRIYEIENAPRNGVRLATLYVIAHAFGVEITEFLPTVDEMVKAVNLGKKSVEFLSPFVE